MIRQQPITTEEEFYKVNHGKTNKETASNLLVKFFEYYGYFYDSTERISIHKDISEIQKFKTDNYAFSIEDPFDLSHNPGKSMIYGSLTHQKFIQAMRTEVNYLLNGEYVKRLETIIEHSKNYGK